MEKYGAVIVAAGMSTRMKQFKQLMTLGDRTFAERIVDTFHRAGVRDIVMVTGYRAEELEKSLRGLGITFLRNENYETTQMFDSARIGLGYLKDRCDRIFFTPVDVPLFKMETILAEMKENADVVVPSTCNHRGHPLCLSRRAVEFALEYSGERGLRGACEAMSRAAVGSTVHVAVRDEGAIMDADTREDYRKLLELHNARVMRQNERRVPRQERSVLSAGNPAL